MKCRRILKINDKNDILSIKRIKINNFAKTHIMGTDNTRERLTPQDMEDILRMYNARKDGGETTLSEIAEYIGCTQQAVSAFLKRAGVTSRVWVDFHEIGEIERTCDDGSVAKAVAVKYGITPEAARYWVRKYKRITGKE